MKTVAGIATCAHVYASSEYNNDHSYSVKGARLNYQGTCWCARDLDVMQFLHVGFEIPHLIVRVATQGRADADQWISEYYLKWSLDGEEWNVVEGGRLFQGNTDRNTIVKHDISPILARCIRFCPTKWNSHMSMRCEVYYAEQDN